MTVAESFMDTSRWTGVYKTMNLKPAKCREDHKIGLEIVHNELFMKKRASNSFQIILMMFEKIELVNTE